MPNIKPISDLRNYTEVLKETSEGAPVFLTKNGRGEYVILDMKDYDTLSINSINAVPSPWALDVLIAS